MVVNLVTLAALMTLLVVVNVPVIVPVMTIVGPLMVAQYGYWYRRRRPERTMQEYNGITVLDRRKVVVEGYEEVSRPRRRICHGSPVAPSRSSDLR